MRNVFVFDLDGVLADSDPDRIALIQPDGSCDWPKYYACDFLKDGYNKDAFALAESVFWGDEDAELVFLTSRSESARRQTMMWLCRGLHFAANLCHEVKLIMRRDDDERPAHIIKPEYLRAAGYTPDTVAFVIDDEAKNVKALQEAGYLALHYQRGTGADESTARTEGAR